MKDSYIIKEIIEKFALTHGTLVEETPLDNYIIVNNVRYYLKDFDWQTLYEKLLSDKFSKLNDDFIVNEEKNLKLGGLTDTIKRALSNYINEYPSEHGRKTHVYLIGNILSTNLDLYTNCIYYSIQNAVNLAVNKDKLSDMFSFEMLKANMSLLLGKAVITTYLDNIPELNFFKEDLLGIKDLSVMDPLEAMFNSIFYIFKNKRLNYTLTKDEINILRSALLLIQLNIKDNLLLEIICIHIIQFCLRKSKKEDIRFMGIMSSLINLNIDKSKIYLIDRYLSEILKDHYIALGGIIVIQLIEGKLFYSKIKYDQEKTIPFVELNSTLIYNFMANTSYFRPYLVLSNINALKVNVLKTTSNNVTFELKLKEIMHLVHLNNTGEGLILDDSLFNTEPESLLVRLSIDQDFLLHYLKFIEPIINQKFNIDDPLVYNFLSIYTINFKSLYSNIPKDYIFLINDIIEFALDFKSFNYDKIVRRLDILDERTTKENLVEIIRKIATYKLILRNTLGESIIYSSFGYFLGSSFFDFRGRRYFLGLIFNLQSYPFMKAFVKLYEPKNLAYVESNKQVITNALIASLEDKTLQQIAKDLLSDFQQYELVITEAIIDFIYSFLNQATVSKEDFMKFFYEDNITFSDMFSFLIKHIKKKDRLLMILSYINLEKTNKDHTKPYVNVYSYDAVISGYQMLAILFRSKSLGEYCNLTGNSKKDLYVEVNSAFNQLIDNIIIPLTTNFDSLFGTSELCNYDAKSTFEPNTLSDIVTDEELLIKLLTIDFKQYSVNIVLNLVNQLRLSTLALHINNIECSEYSWFYLSNNLSSTYIDLKNNDPFLNKLLFLKESYYFRSILRANSWIQEFKVLTKRELFKKTLMIEIYGGTYSGRRKDFNSFFSEVCKDLGVLKIDRPALNKLKDYLELYFTNHKKTKLTEVNSLKEISKILSKRNKAIEYTNNHFKITYFPLAQDTVPTRINISGLKSNKQNSSRITIYRPLLEYNSTLQDPKPMINLKKLKSIFSPNFIHSMDSMPVHEMMIRIYILNKLLKSLGLVFGLYTIHDNFSIGRLLLPFLPLFIRDSYKKLYHHDYLQGLVQDLTEEEKDAILSFCNTPYDDNYMDDAFDNPYFIKKG